MHDVLEGSLELCVRHLLVHCICEEKLFSLEALNARIKSFGYGVDGRNKPTSVQSVSVDIHLKQSGEYWYDLSFLMCRDIMILNCVDEYL